MAIRNDMCTVCSLLGKLNELIPSTVCLIREGGCDVVGSPQFVSHTLTFIELEIMSRGRESVHLRSQEIGSHVTLHTIRPHNRTDIGSNGCASATPTPSAISSWKGSHRAHNMRTWRGLRL